MTKIVFQEESSGELSSRSSVSSLRRLRKVLVEARLLGIAQYRTTTVRSRRVFLVKLGRLGLEHGIAKDSARTEASSVEAGSSWPEADGTTSADDTLAVKSAGEARFFGIREFAESSGGDGLSWSRANASPPLQQT